MTDTQFDDANDDEVAIASVPQPTALEVLSDEALDRALTRKVRTLLTRGPCVLIVQVPEADWVEPIDEALGRFAKNAVTKKATELTRSSGVDHRVGGESLRYLQRGRSVIYISQDPDEILDEAVIAAADAIIKISPPTPALLRKVIRRVGRATARGVTAEMAGLPLTVILSAIRPGLAARQCVANLSRAALKSVKAPASRVPLLTAIPLNADLRSWTNRTVADLAAVTSGSLSADQLVFGVLEGAPGTGKSLIAESLARTAGWSFVPSSVGDWFTSGDGALGGVARNLKGFVDAVLATENTIGFMDELDSLPDRATMEDRSRTWWTPIINLFLVEIDRLRKSNRKILLLGGTNFYARLDKALVRPGRLQQRITVMPPQTIDEVVAVLRFYLGDQLRQVDLGSLARIGLGATPAMIEGWVKQARGAARADNRQLQPADILAQMVPEDRRAPADVRSIALHEAGHALVAHRLGHAVETVTIIPQGDSGGHTRSALPTLVPTLDHLRDAATVMLAGRAADVVLGSGANAGAAGDLEAATRLLLGAFERQGLGESLIFAPALVGKPSDLTARVVAEDLRCLLARAIAIIEAERDLALTLADRLIESKVLAGDEVAKILGVRRASGLTSTPPPAPLPSFANL